jgi:hypothetical protein
MSKERELLRRIKVLLECSNMEPLQRQTDLIVGEIKELLTQPEQTEQEPVAWKVIDKTNGEYMFSRIKPTERSYKYDVVIPLYTAPPKREPLSEKEITKNTPKLIHIGERLAFHAGVRFAEKHHGIGGGE